jgi:hypothetical protein
MVKGLTMQSQWDDWLRELASAGKGGRALILPPISRGMSYLHIMDFEADVSADAFSADLRLTPDADATLLATFTVTVGAFDGTVTPVTFELSAVQVDAITADDDDFNGLTEVIFNLFHTPGGGDQYRAAGTNIVIAE